MKLFYLQLEPVIIVFGGNSMVCELRFPQQISFACVCVCVTVGAIPVQLYPAHPRCKRGYRLPPAFDMHPLCVCGRALSVSVCVCVCVCVRALCV